VSNHSASDVGSTPVLALQLSSSDLFAPVSLSAQPELVTITLTYNVTCAGSVVTVAPLDGGGINGTSGWQQVTVASDGTVYFTFQAPSKPGRYHVLTRLSGAEIGFAFDVANSSTTGN